MYPCKNPAAKRSPAPVRSTIFKFFCIPLSITSSPLIATAPFSPLVITTNLSSFFEKFITSSKFFALINEDDVSSDAIKKSEIIFLEGYLWDEGEPKKAFDKAINKANKVAMSLSDLFCVDRHKPNFLNLVKNKLDITFANEQEITSLIEAKNFDEVINFSKQLNKLVVITRGEKGAIAINGDEVVENDIQKNLKIVDLTGAGDLFAAGFLHGFINKLPTKECLDKGTDMSSRVIQQIGARL